MHHHEHELDPECGEACATGKKNRYFEGKRIKQVSFEVEQTYHIERRRLLNRTIHGWGVVCGLALRFPGAGNPPGLVVEPGMALDKAGRELVQNKEKSLLAEDLLSTDDLAWLQQNAGAEAQPDWLLSVHFCEVEQGPVRVGGACGCDCERREYDYLCETVSYSLRRFDREDRHACDHAGLAPRTDCTEGVPLGCVTLKLNACKKPEFAGVSDACGPRRLGNLTRISEISWAELHRNKELIGWDVFSGFFHVDTGNTDFTVRFSGPVQCDTLAAECFAMTVIVRDASAWDRPRRVPIKGVLTSPPHRGDPEHTTRSASLIVSKQWIYGELVAEDTIFSKTSLVEIEVRGDFILDICGQPIDANARGLEPVPSGNGTPGGTFLSVFRVQERRLSPTYNTKGNES
jgi:hypothetical protein